MFAKIATLLRGTPPLPDQAKAALAMDKGGVPATDPGPEAVIAACADWLCRAQDNSASGDPGVARDYSLIKGWATSYPETTGYIVPTMFAVADHLGRPRLAERARAMLDWLVSIQRRDGGFQGGRIDSEPVVSVTFNTGQILIGLAAGVERFGEPYQAAMHAAARFLRDSLDADGCWRSHPTPFAKPGEKAYETHVSWGLFEAERQAPDHGYGAAGLRQIDWALTKMAPNGWVADCCLSDASKPLTHTLGYYLKGLVEAHRLSGRADILTAAARMAQGLASAQRPDGALPGRLDENWRAAVRWSCLTGNVQIADSWYYLADAAGADALAAAADRATAFVRRTIRLDGPDGQRGGVKGSFPVNGDYGRFEYLNWAAKFTIDACMTERARSI
ncbi:MAG: hypothetical protein ACFB22_11215 [Rhodothalassiaceae bacterium]